MLTEYIPDHRKERDNRLLRFAALIISSIVVLALGYSDYIAGPYISFQIFYLIPIALVAWFAGLWFSITPLALSVLIWLFDETLRSPDYGNPAIPYWNLVIKIIFFVIFIYTLHGLRRALDREKTVSRIDYLTGIANSRYFHEMAYKELNRTNRYDRPLTLAYIDLDNFKRINDTFGHVAGDTMLRTTAYVLKNSVRASDTVARIGGDEFAILFPETDYASGDVVAGRIRREILSMIDKNRWFSTISMGVLTCINPPSNIDTLITKADRLMYLAKEEGKNIIKHESI